MLVSSLKLSVAVCKCMCAGIFSTVSGRSVVWSVVCVLVSSLKLAVCCMCAGIFSLSLITVPGRVR